MPQSEATYAKRKFDMVAVFLGGPLLLLDTFCGGRISKWHIFTHQQRRSRKTRGARYFAERKITLWHISAARRAHRVA